jgi:hypothetical protein
MRKGTRTIFRQCECGCGETVSPYVSPTTGRVEGYPKFIPGHGQKLHHKRLSEKYRNDPMSHPCAKPLGSTRLHDAGNGLIYRVVKVAPRGRWPYEHRHIAETRLGKRLDSKTHVHHKNETPLDNEPDNLMVMVREDHVSLHNSIQSWSKLFPSCTQCGTTSRRHSGFGLCSSCSQKQPTVKAYHRDYERARRARIAASSSAKG